MCRLFSPTVQQQAHFFLETALLLDSWRIDPVFGTGTGWTFCYIQMAWQLRDNDLGGIYAFFFVLGDVGCCCFYQEKHNFTPMIWLIWEKWSMGHFLMGHSKGAVYSSSQNRKGVFLEYCTGNLYRLVLKHFLSEMHHWIGDASILKNSHPKKSLPYSMAKGMQLLGTFKTP